MTSRRTIRASPPAKVNLRLEVLAQEREGYHQIETVFCTTSLTDTLEIETHGNQIDLEVVGAELGDPRKNLVYRAADTFYAIARIEPGVRIRLTKRIPSGAGLGGGSSDAAHTLLALNRIYGDPLKPESINRIGASLGSDIPFFLSETRAALAWGRGERIMPIKPPPPAPILIVVPEFRIATADAYQLLARGREGRNTLLKPRVIDPDLTSSWEEIARVAQNDFEAPIFDRYPRLRSIRVALQDAGATISMLSGSGSALFGVFPDQEAREQALPLVRVGAPGCQIIEAEISVG